MIHDIQSLLRSPRLISLVRVLLLTLFALVVLRAAWLTEDAYTTFRTVENFVGGDGLRWNVAERVQAYTHPLWMLLVSLVYFFTSEIYYSVILLSLVVSIAAVYILASHIAPSLMAAVLAIAALTLSRAFVDYSTSGLENSLTHLLLAVFLLHYLRIAQGESKTPESLRVALLSFWAGLAVLNRLDIVLIVGPPLAYVVLKQAFSQWRGRRLLRTLGMATLGLSPVILWELFSVLYYGFPFPNTAYGKLSVVHPKELTEQGFHYLLNSLSWDPLTLVLIVGLLAYIFLPRPRGLATAFIGLGCLLYLLYVVRIGGDFMSGRYLTAPLFCSAVLLARADVRPVPHGVIVLGLIVLLGMSAVHPTLKSDDLRGALSADLPKGITDERIVYYAVSGLMQANRTVIMPNYPWQQHQAEARRLAGHVVRCAIGFYGFHAGPGEHIIDICGLADPLLARLPIDYPRYQKGTWRIGHYNRDIPEGYPSSVTGRNVIADPSLAAYWSKLCVLTRDSLFSWTRLREIWRFNRGRYDHLIDEYCARNQYIDHRYVRNLKAEGTDWNTPGNYLLNRHGIGIKFGSVDGRHYATSLAGGERYELLYLRDGEEIAREEIDLSRSAGGRLTIYHGSFKADAFTEGFDMIRIVPVPRRQEHSFGHLRLVLPPISTTLAQIRMPKPDGTRWDEEGNSALTQRDLLVLLNEIEDATELEISADCNDSYRITFFLGRLELGQSVVPKWVGEGGGLRRRRVRIPHAATARGYDRLLITPVEGDAMFSVGHVRFPDNASELDR